MDCGWPIKSASTKSGFCIVKVNVPQRKIILFFFAAITILAGCLFFYFSGHKKISGVVVPHHNLVAGQRAQLFAELAKSIAQPKTIILLSPNHYFAGHGNIQTTNQEWELGQGRITADNNVISFLVENNLATNESSSFISEHGIYNILADIHNNFPNAKLVPLIFKKTSQAQLQNLESGLLETCSRCLMIASVDFSHYFPASSSQHDDSLSIQELQNLDIIGILANTNVDSGSALALLTLWAKNHDTVSFILKNHTDSGVIVQNSNLEATTHVFGWYER
jgi:AmmeMemoRadiSam system protein B